VLNEQGKFCAKIFLHYADIVIFVLGHFIVTHPVHHAVDVAVLFLALYMVFLKRGTLKQL